MSLTNTMNDNLMDNYNPLYDVHLRQYFSLPHMQRHLRHIGLLDDTGQSVGSNNQEVSLQHHAMVDKILRNREAELQKYADLQRKLDAAEKIEICRRIRNGVTSPSGWHWTKPSRSLSRGRHVNSNRRRRSSTSTDDKDLIKKIEAENEEATYENPSLVFNRLSTNILKYRYLHKLDDETLTAYMEQLRRQLGRLERFRQVSFGPYSVARHQNDPQVSWFFRRRSLPSLTDTTPTTSTTSTITTNATATHTNMHEQPSLRSMELMKQHRSRSGKSQSPRKSVRGSTHESRRAKPNRRLSTENSHKLPHIMQNVTGAQTPFRVTHVSKSSSADWSTPSMAKKVAQKTTAVTSAGRKAARAQKAKSETVKSTTFPELAVVDVPAIICESKNANKLKEESVPSSQKSPLDSYEKHEVLGENVDLGSRKEELPGPVKFPTSFAESSKDLQMEYELNHSGGRLEGTQNELKYEDQQQLQSAHNLAQEMLEKTELEPLNATSVSEFQSLSQELRLMESLEIEPHDNSLAEAKHPELVLPNVILSPPSDRSNDEEAESVQATWKAETLSKKQSLDEMSIAGETIATGPEIKYEDSCELKDLTVGVTEEQKLVTDYMTAERELRTNDETIHASAVSLKTGDVRMPEDEPSKLPTAAHFKEEEREVSVILQKVHTTERSAEIYKESAKDFLDMKPNLEDVSSENLLHSPPITELQAHTKERDPEESLLLERPEAKVLEDTVLYTKDLVDFMQASEVSDVTADNLELSTTADPEKQTYSQAQFQAEGLYSACTEQQSTNVSLIDDQATNQAELCSEGFGERLEVESPLRQVVERLTAEEFMVSAEAAQEPLPTYREMQHTSKIQEGIIEALHEVSPKLDTVAFDISGRGQELSEIATDSFLTRNPEVVPDSSSFILQSEDLLKQNEPFFAAEHHETITNSNIDCMNTAAKTQIRSNLEGQVPDSPLVEFNAAHDMPIKVKEKELLSEVEHLVLDINETKLPESATSPSKVQEGESDYIGKNNSESFDESHDLSVKYGEENNKSPEFVSSNTAETPTSITEIVDLQCTDAQNVEEIFSNVNSDDSSIMKQLLFSDFADKECSNDGKHFGSVEKADQPQVYSQPLGTADELHVELKLESISKTQEPRDDFVSDNGEFMDEKAKIKKDRSDKSYTITSGEPQTANVVTTETEEFLHQSCRKLEAKDLSETNSEKISLASFDSGGQSPALAQQTVESMQSLEHSGIEHEAFGLKTTRKASDTLKKGRDQLPETMRVKFGNVIMDKITVNVERVVTGIANSFEKPKRESETKLEETGVENNMQFAKDQRSSGESSTAMSKGSENLMNENLGNDFGTTDDGVELFLQSEPDSENFNMVQLASSEQNTGPTPILESSHEKPFLTSTVKTDDSNIINGDNHSTQKFPESSSEEKILVKSDLLKVKSMPTEINNGLLLATTSEDALDANSVEIKSTVKFYGETLKPRGEVSAEDAEAVEINARVEGEDLGVFHELKNEGSMQILKAAETLPANTREMSGGTVILGVSDSDKVCQKFATYNDELANEAFQKHEQLKGSAEDFAVEYSASMNKADITEQLKAPNTKEITSDVAGEMEQTVQRKEEKNCDMLERYMQDLLHKVVQEADETLKSFTIPTELGRDDHIVGSNKRQSQVILGHTQSSAESPTQLPEATFVESNSTELSPIQVGNSQSQSCATEVRNCKDGIEVPNLCQLEILLPNSIDVVKKTESRCPSQELSEQSVTRNLELVASMQQQESYASAEFVREVENQREMKEQLWVVGTESKASGRVSDFPSVPVNELADVGDDEIAESHCVVYGVSGDGLKILGSRNGSEVMTKKSKDFVVQNDIIRVYYNGTSSTTDTNGNPARMDDEKCSTMKSGSTRICGSDENANISAQAQDGEYLKEMNHKMPSENGAEQYNQ